MKNQVDFFINAVLQPNRSRWLNWNILKSIILSASVLIFIKDNKSARIKKLSIKPWWTITRLSSKHISHPWGGVVLVAHRFRLTSRGWPVRSLRATPKSLWRWYEDKKGHGGLWGLKSGNVRVVLQDRRRFIGGNHPRPSQRQALLNILLWLIDLLVLSPQIYRTESSGH